MARTAKKAPEEHPFYHDTWKLLKNYRDVAWNLEIADLDLQAEMRAEYGTAEGGSLAALTEAGADLHGTRIESFARSLERSRRMMQLLDTAIQLMRRRHKKGELYYWVLYYTYLSPAGVWQLPRDFARSGGAFSAHVPPHLLHPPGGCHQYIEQRAVGVYLAGVREGAGEAGVVRGRRTVTFGKGALL